MTITSKQVEAFLYNWVTEYFGQSEADDPSYNLELLAEDLAAHFNKEAA